MRTGLLLLIAFPAAAADKLYFPPDEASKWEAVTPAAAGWNADALNGALDLAGARRSSGVVVLHRGKLMAEKRWVLANSESKNGQPLEDVASVQKSVAAVLAIIAAEKDLLKYEDLVSKYLGAGWTKASPEQESRVTVRHLLTMTSGLKDSLEFENEAGARWRYNSVAYQKLHGVLSKAAGKTLNELTREWVTGPTGMRDSLWRDRPGTNDMHGFVTTPRDMARFGLMVAAGGVWNGKRIVKDEAHLREALRPSQEHNRAYGFLWWLNGQPTVRANGARGKILIPSAPTDLVAALGALGRKIYVVPSLQLVVTRTGANSDAQGEPPFDEAFWQLLMKAAPGR